MLETGTRLILTLSYKLQQIFKQLLRHCFLLENLTLIWCCRREELSLLECLARAPLTASPSEHAEVGKVRKKYTITVVGTAMAANPLQLLTTSLGNQSSYLLSSATAELLRWAGAKKCAKFSKQLTPGTPRAGLVKQFHYLSCTYLLGFGISHPYKGLCNSGYSEISTYQQSTKSTSRLKYRFQQLSIKVLNENKYCTGKAILVEVPSALL